MARLYINHNARKTQGAITNSSNIYISIPFVFCFVISNLAYVLAYALMSTQTLTPTLV